MDVSALQIFMVLYCIVMITNDQQRIAVVVQLFYIVFNLIVESYFLYRSSHCHGTGIISS